LSSSSHAPWPEQPPGHVFTSHSAPDQPGSHSHLPAPAQRPWKWHSLGQLGIAQSGPVCDGSHMHTPASEHWPLPEQSLGHDFLSHAGPDQRWPANAGASVTSWHSQWPVLMWHSPCSTKRTAQSSPR